jgi:hypothetical protein
VLKPEVGCCDSFWFTVACLQDRKGFSVELTGLVVGVSNNKRVAIGTRSGEISPSARPWDETEMKAAPSRDASQSVRVGMDLCVWAFCNLNRSCGNWLSRGDVHYSTPNFR